MHSQDVQVLDALQRWAAEGHGAALVTVVRTWGSAPRPPGAWMALRDARAIDPDQPIVKCCNMAWQVERVERSVMEANRAGLWSDRSVLERLVGPCVYLRQADGTCAHHRYLVACEYLKTHFFEDGDGEKRSFVTHRHPLAARFLETPPVFDLALARKEVGTDG